MSWPDVGDLPTWIGSLTSLGALGAAICAARAASASLRSANDGLEIERTRDQRREAALQRAQAELIAAVPARTMVPASGDPLGIEPAVPAPAVAVINRSNLPVYGVEVTIPEASGVGTVRPGSTVEDPLSWSRLREGAHFSDPDIAKQLWSDNPDPLDDADAALRLLDAWERYGWCAIEFTDAAQQRWARSIDGTLTRVQGN